MTDMITEMCKMKNKQNELDLKKTGMNVQIVCSSHMRKVLAYMRWGIWFFGTSIKKIFHRLSCTSSQRGYCRQKITDINKSPVRKWRVRNSIDFKHLLAQARKMNTISCAFVPMRLCETLLDFVDSQHGGAKIRKWKKYQRWMVWELKNCVTMT